MTRLLCLSALALVVACAPSRRGGDDGENDDTDAVPTDTADAGDEPHDNNPDPIDAGTPHDGGSVTPDGAPVCAGSADCPNWVCECGSGPPVNSRRCVNGRCLDAPQGCPAACEGFGTCWTGYAEGGWDGGSNAGPNLCRSTTPDAGPVDAGPPPGCGDGTSFADLGKACVYGTECASTLCYGNPSYSLVCTKRCDDESNCPSAWKCVRNAQGFDICMIGDPISSPVSQNTGCAQVSFSDVGESCSRAADCQSKICMNAGYCSRRCETSAECDGLSCGGVNSNMFTACLR